MDWGWDCDDIIVTPQKKRRLLDPESEVKHFPAGPRPPLIDELRKPSQHSGKPTNVEEYIETWSGQLPMLPSDLQDSRFRQ